MNLAEELWEIGVAAVKQHAEEINHPPEDPGLTEEDVDKYAEEYARTLQKAQARLGYRPYDVKTGETF